jgi:hypothetical protein
MSRALPLVLLFLAVLYLPFINKPVHMDDGNFIAMSGALNLSLSVKPGVTYYYMGDKTENYVPFDSTHPPFIPFFLKIVSLVTGGYREYLMHAGFLIFSALLLLSTLMLAGELDIRPVPALMMICGNAALLPVSHNLMADGPMISLWMFASFLLISGIRRNMKDRVLFSFPVMTVAALISYQTLLILPTFVFFIVLSKGKIDARTVRLFLLPVACLVLFLLYVTLRYNSPVSGVLSEIGRGLEADRLFNKALSIPVNVGLSMLFILPLGYRDILSSRKALFMAAAALLITIPPVMSLSYPLAESLWLILLASTGLFSIVYVIRLALVGFEDRPLGFFLLSWIGTMLFVNLFIVPFGALRYVMPALVPMAFIMLKKTFSGRALMVSSVLTALLGLAVAYGDYLFASSYRDFSDEAGRTVGTAKERVWYTGEWGMHYYMDKQGFRYLARESNEPREGDLIMVADVPKLWGPPPGLYRRMKLIDVREINSWYPFRVMGLDTRTGYYSTLWGYQPFTLSSRPIERFGIFRVESR